jgi:hypothetical protein
MVRRGHWGGYGEAPVGGYRVVRNDDVEGRNRFVPIDDLIVGVFFLTRRDYQLIHNDFGSIQIRPTSSRGQEIRGKGVDRAAPVRVLERRENHDPHQSQYNRHGNGATAEPKDSTR